MSDLQKNLPKPSNARSVDPFGRSLLNPKQYGVFLESLERAGELWTGLVDAVGER